MAGLGPVSPNVLVVGWGFLGSCIGNRLLASGVNVTGLTRSRTWRTQAAIASGARIAIADACEPGVLDDLVRDVGHVVFCGGGLTPPSAAARPLDAAAATLLPLLAVLERVRATPGVGLTYISSGGAVYGDAVRLPVRESDSTRPISPYGASHLAAEAYAQMTARRSGSLLQIVRCANVYGPTQAFDRDQGAVAIFMHRILRGLPIRIFGDGSALRDYVFSDDVARVVSTIVIDRLNVGIVNLGSGRGLTVLEVVQAISDAVGKPAKVEFEPARDYDVRAVVLDVTRLQSLMTYSPTDFAHGLAMTVAALADHGRRGSDKDLDAPRASAAS